MEILLDVDFAMTRYVSAAAVIVVDDGAAANEDHGVLLCAGPGGRRLV